MNKNTFSQTEEKSETAKKKRKIIIRKPKPAVLAAVAAVLAVIIGLSVYAGAYSDILPNVSVSGVYVGRMSKAEATAALEKAFIEPNSQRMLTLKCDGREKTVKMSDLGAVPDISASVEDAYKKGREHGFFTKLFSLISSGFAAKNIPLDVEVSADACDSAISELAKGLETPTVEPSYTISGNTLTISKGKHGKKIDREKARTQIAEAVKSPKMSELTFTVEDAAPEELDALKLCEELSAPAKDAYFKLENGNVVVADEIPSVKVDKGKIKKALESGENPVVLAVETTPPKVTAAELKSLLFRDTLASYSSNYRTSSSARSTNVELAASRINNYILMPGDVFSYDKTIGARTAANGYREAGVYIGNKVESGIGGGICQTSSTLYSAALYANLEIVQRTSHSLPVSYVPAGQDATIAQGYIDLKIKNNTNYPIIIVAVTGNKTVTCKFIGTKVGNETVEIINTKTGTLEPKTVRTYSNDVPKGYKLVKSKGSPGYTVSSKRIVKRGGEVIKTENLTKSVYHATDIEEEINPADKETPTSALKIYSAEAKAAPEESVPANAQTPPKETTGEETKPEQGTENGSTAGGESGSDKPAEKPSESTETEVTVIDVPKTE